MEPGVQHRCVYRFHGGDSCVEDGPHYVQTYQTGAGYQGNIMLWYFKIIMICHVSALTLFIYIYNTFGRDLLIRLHLLVKYSLERLQVVIEKKSVKEKMDIKSCGQAASVWLN